MKKTKKNIKETVRAYLANRDYTAFCRKMALMGLSEQSDMEDAIGSVYSWQWLYRRHDILSFILCCPKHHEGGLAKKKPALPLRLSEHDKYLYEKDNQQNHPNYFKCLIEGEEHIYWASPFYQHRDYNKRVWRKNIPENRAKAKIINAYLLKGWTFEEEEKGRILMK